MLRGRASHRLKIGRFFGIDVFIHWTFWFLLIAVAGSSLAEDESFTKALLAVGQILSLFLCVTLHEYGHALTARRFGVNTIDITLLPIGGLARLERMPREPFQELLIAVAGPAVNVVIALAAGIGIYFQFRGVTFDSVEGAIEVIVEYPLGWLALMNCVLVLFNMIPAFPMDGGRVLRAIFATVLDYSKATRLAARVGLVVAFAMGALGIYLHHIPMVLISAFIGYAGWSEARQVELLDMYRDIRIDSALFVPSETLVATHSLNEILTIFSRTDALSLPVLGVERYWLGMLDLRVALEAAQKGLWHLRASELVDTDAPVIIASEDLAQQMMELGGIGESISVIDSSGRFLGLLNFQTARLRTQLAAARQNPLTFSLDEPVVGRLVEPSANPTLRPPNSSDQDRGSYGDSSQDQPTSGWSGDHYA